MAYDDFIILDIEADLDAVRRRRSAESERLARPIGGRLSADEVLVAKPRGVPIESYVRIEQTSSARDAADARRDSRKLVARSMPVSVIRPVSNKDAGLADGADPITKAKAAKMSWGIAEVLGELPCDVSGRKVKVAVLDTGIDAGHSAFAGMQVTGRNFTAGRENDLDVADSDGHGTHCAGTIFGRDVDNVRIGVACGVTDVLIGKVIDDDGFGSTKALLDALKWAHTNGANIISMSLGFDFPKMQKSLMADGYEPELATSVALKAYRDNLRQFETLANLLMQENDDSKGTVLVAAAGNESRRQSNPDFVIDVSIPAAAALDMMSVGAAAMSADGTLDVAHFSNINPRVAGPGVGIVSANHRGGLAAKNGTSMACPHVAGVAALWWEWIASRNAGQVRASDVRAQVHATARGERFSAEWTVTDRGAGCVTGPQNLS